MQFTYMGYEVFGDLKGGDRKSNCGRSLGMTGREDCGATNTNIYFIAQITTVISSEERATDALRVERACVTPKSPLKPTEGLNGPPQISIRHW